MSWRRKSATESLTFFTTVIHSSKYARQPEPSCETRHRRAAATTVSCLSLPLLPVCPPCITAPRPFLVSPTSSEQLVPAGRTAPHRAASCRRGDRTASHLPSTPASTTTKDFTGFYHYAVPYHCTAPQRTTTAPHRPHCTAPPFPLPALSFCLAALRSLTRTRRECPAP